MSLASHRIPSAVLIRVVGAAVVYGLSLPSSVGYAAAVPSALPITRESAALAGPAPEQPSDPIVRLLPFVVEEKLLRGEKAAAVAPFQVPDVVGNLDLPRSQDDVLPYTVFDRERIHRSGAIDLEEFMRRELLESSPTGAAGQKGAPGLGGLSLEGTSLKLRGYGSDETVILVNGRRLPESVVSGAAAQPQSPNLNLIPLSLIEKVEVLPVSASALYSGNPVGGVVNIVLRANANVSEATAQYANALGGFDAPQSTFSVLHGQSLLGGTLRVRLNASWSKTVPATESELGYIQAQSSRSPTQGRLYRATPNLRSADGSPLFGPGSPAVTSVAPGADGRGGLAAFSGREGVRNLALFDAASGIGNSPATIDFPYGQQQESTSTFASVVYDVFPCLQVGVDGMFSRTTVTRGYDLLAADLRMAADSALNPFGRPVVVSLNERAPLLGDTYSEAQREFSSLLVGLLVRLPAEWRVSLDAQQGRSVTRYRGLAGANNARWQQLVDRGVYQPLRDTQVFGPPTEFYHEVLIYAGGRDRVVRVGDYETLDTALRITNPALRFPTGTAAINVGGDFRLTELAGYTDEQRFGDGSLATAPVRWTGRTLQRASVFGELQAPLLPARWLPGWIREFQTDLAARYTIADTTQEANVAPTAGVKLGLAGGFSLRGSMATSNRLPTPFMNTRIDTAPRPKISSAGGVNYVSIFDPKRAESYGVRASDALNPNLKPESAVTRTVGVIFERGSEHRVRAAVDFVDTKKSGELIYLDPQTLLNLEEMFPGRVIRESAEGPRPGYVTTVLKGNFNVAWRQSQNVNTSLDYIWTKCRGGTLELFGRWMEFTRYDRQILPGVPAVDLLNAPDGSSPGLLKHRMNFGGGWSNRSYGARLDGHFFGDRTLPAVEWTSQGGRNIEPYWQFDVSLQKNLISLLPWKSSRHRLEAQLRINNVLDAAPPAYANDPSGAGVQAYTDWRGQTYSLSLRATF